MNPNLKNRGKVLLIIGVLALIIGIWMYATNDSEAVNAANLEIMQNATNATDAAQQISANNRSETGNHMLAMFLMGMGGVLTLFSIVILLAKKSEEVGKS